MSHEILSDWNQFTNPEYIGEGAAGIVFKAQYKGEESILKFIFVLPKNDAAASIYDNVCREAYIGHKLSELPDEIRNGFATTSVLFHVNGSIAKEWQDKIPSFSEFKKPARNAVKTYGLLQNFVTGQTMNTWMGSIKDNPFSKEIVRAFAFQTMIILAAAQSQLGFQHNDIAQKNIIVRPVKNAITKKYLLNGDLFEFTIPGGGAEPVFIDMGAASLRPYQESTKISKFLRPSKIGTLGYLPFDGQNDAARVTRKNDADTAGIFNIVLDMILHNRKALPSGWLKQDIWRMTVEESNFLITVSNQISDQDIERIADEFNSNQIDSELSNMITVYIFMARVLEINVSETRPKKGSSKFWETLKKKSFTDLIDSITTKNNSQLLYKDMFENVEKQLKACFTDAEYKTAKSFLRLLFLPWSYQRAAFGLTDTPFKEYGLLNGVYHAFFAFYYWKPYTNQTAIDLGNIEIPLAYNTQRDDQKDLIVKDGEAFFGAGKNLDVKKATLPPTPPKIIDPPTESFVEEEKDDKKIVDNLIAELEYFKTLFYVKAIPGSNSLTDQKVEEIMSHVSTVSSIILNSISDKAYKALVVAWPAKGYGWTKKKDENGRFYIKESYQVEEDEVVVREIFAKDSNNNVSLKNSGYKGELSPEELYSEIFWTVLMTLAAKQVAEDRIPIPQPKNFEAMIESIILTPKKTKYRTVVAQAKNYKATLNALKFDEELEHITIESNICSIGRQLEIIERIPHFKFENGDYNLSFIHETLVGPLKDAAATVQNGFIGNVLNNLGLFDEHQTIIKSGYETKYYHTLSLAAKLIESNDDDEVATMELANRIQSEWPHDLLKKPQHVPGTVFDI